MRHHAALAASIAFSLTCATGSLAQSTSLSLPTLLAAPFPSEISAAPSGGGVAWVLNERGARNLWVASPPNYAGRRLTTYSADDGQEISGLSWTTDGRSIFYVRGGAANRAGEVPNPAQIALGVESAIYRIAVAGGEPVRVGRGGAPIVSPTGTGAIIGRGKLWYLALDSANREAELLVNVRGDLGNTRWSPDGTKLSFASGRGDHSFIGVYDLQSKGVRFMAPSVDSDGAQVWSPDATRVAFVRRSASSELNLFKPERSGRPWSILVADVATGVARTVWTASEGDGSVPHEVVGVDQLLWGAGDRLVFPWEKDGWNHLYSIPATGGTPLLLTPGDFEVEYVTLSRDRREVIFNSNQGDIDRRHLWRVGVEGGAPVAVTRGDGIEWAPTELSDGSIAFLASDARTPAQAARVPRGGGVATALAPQALAADFPSAQFVQPQAVMVTATDGMRIPAQLFVPRDLKPGERRPAAIFFHGGSRRQMLLGYHYGEYYHNSYAMNQYLASRGFMVLAVNYRSGVGYGLAFREAERYGASGASEFNDVVGAGLFMRGRSDVDPTRIGIWGGSYGGFLTAMGLARAPELFAAGVDIHGVHDWNVGIRTFVPSYNVLLDPASSRLARESSPMAFLDRWKAPVLVIHGDDDRNVSFAETVTLVESLRKRGVEVEQLVFPDEVHSFLRNASWLATYSAMGEFFERRLKK